MELPPSCLDLDSMFSHQFIERTEPPLQYRLTFNKQHVVHITLPAPAFFDSQTKGRYIITREEADEYERSVEAARLHATAQAAIAAASQYDPSFTYGYPPGYPWQQTNLGQKPKLGGVCISHRLYIHVHTLVVGAHTLSLYYPCQFKFLFLVLFLCV